MQPTSQPTRQPSQQPTCIPSRQSSPSTILSTQPTMQSMAQPSEILDSRRLNRLDSRHQALLIILPVFRALNLEVIQRHTILQSSRGAIRQLNQPLTTMQSSGQPSRQPSSQPSRQPSRHPSSQPTKFPYSMPTSQPTSLPTFQPLAVPSKQPSNQPTASHLVNPQSRLLLITTYSYTNLSAKQTTIIST